MSFCRELFVSVRFGVVYLHNFEKNLKNSRNPFLICLVTMYSSPAWQQEFEKAFPSCRFVRNTEKPDISATVEPIVDLKKSLEMETNLYFKQLSDSWV